MRREVALFSLAEDPSAIFLLYDHLQMGPNSTKLSKEQAPVVPKVAQSYKGVAVTSEGLQQFINVSLLSHIEGNKSVFPIKGNGLTQLVPS